MENRMKVLDGEIGVVGGGRGAGARKGNVLSILEIGEHQLKRIVLPDALREPMKAGKHARILLGRGLSWGILTPPYIAAVEIGAQKYKNARVIRAALFKTLIYAMIACAIFWRISPVLALISCAGIAAYSAKEFLDWIRF
jgi:hypothetical protein